MKVAVRAKVHSWKPSSAVDMAAVAWEFEVPNIVVNNTREASAPRQLGEEEECLASQL